MGSRSNTGAATATHPHTRPTNRAWYATERARYTEKALARAFPGDRGANWDATRGWQANRSRVTAVYDYYRRTFNQNDGFLWAGLARMAGGSVVSGLDAIPDDNNALVRAFLEAGQDIFMDLAWQHELAVNAPDELVPLTRLHDAEIRGRVSYAAAWTKILGGTPHGIARGNEELLENEQFAIAQPRADKLRATTSRASNAVARVVARASAFTLAIHPYHRDFIIDFPQGDVGNGEIRWAWITSGDGMWVNWVGMPAAERTRLVNLDFDSIVRGDFGDLIPELIPTGLRGRTLASRRSALAHEIVNSYLAGRVRRVAGI